MPASRSAGAGAAWLPAACVAGSVALAMARQPLVGEGNTFLLAQALLHPESLGANVLVNAGLNAPYTLGPNAVSRLLAALAAGLGLPVSVSVAALQLLLWTGCAAAMYRLAREATGDRAAACLAVLFFGSNMPLGLADAPYTLVGVDRCLGLLPLLAAVLELVRGRRWPTLGWLALATYLHPNPAIFVWPLVVLEEALAAWRDPGLRGGALARLGAAGLIGLPMLLSAGGNPFRELDRDYAEMTLSLLGPWLGGTGLVAADWILVLEGYAVLALALWRTRDLPATGLWLRGAGVAMVFVAAGTLAYRYPAPDSALWGVIIKFQPWIALYLPELAGSVLVPLLVVRTVRSDPDLGFPLLAALAVSAICRDYVTRLWAVLLLGTLCAGRRRWAAAVAAGAGLIPFLHAAAPGLLGAAADAAGLRGNLFRLPAFQPAAGAALLALFALGRSLGRRGAPDALRARASLAAAAVVLSAAVLTRRTPPDDALERMAAWVRERTEPGALLMQTPLTLARCLDFMPRSERALLACPEYAILGFNYCPASRAMAERLRDSGIEPARIRGPADLASDLERADRELGRDRLAFLARERGVRYLLASAERPFLGPAVHTEGPYSLYRLEPSFP